jgi:integrase
MASLSVDPLGGNRFKLRWREAVRGPDGAPLKEGSRVVWRARSETVSSKEAATELKTKILRALETVGFYQPETRPELQVASLDAAMVDWCKFKRSRGAADGTVDTLRAYSKRWFRTIRELRGIADDVPVPVAVLSRALFVDALNAWTEEGLSETRRYDCARILYEAWRWIADDEKAYPGTPRPPLSSATVLPLAPERGEAPEPPTLAEMDAIARRARDLDPELGLLVATLRATGLRIGQVLGIRRCDIDADGAALRVRIGKSRREKADQRLVALPRWWIDVAGDRLDGADEPVFAIDYAGAAPAVRACWEAATAAKEVRHEVWEPPNRNKARPDHAFRAGYMAALEASGAPDRVIDFLVGHHPKSTRAASYTRPSLGEMRAIVDAVPAIDWEKPKAVRIVRRR